MCQVEKYIFALFKKLYAIFTCRKIHVDSLRCKDWNGPEEEQYNMCTQYIEKEEYKIICGYFMSRWANTF